MVDIMLENCKRPIIFPLSNPTSKAEADPRWVLEYTDGAAIVASGSPFPPVTVGGREFHIGQGNNAFIFPGVGLGAIASGAKEIRPSLFTAAAHALAGTVSAERMEAGSVYPPIEELFDVSLKVAVAVYKEAVESGLGVGFADGHENIEEKIGDLMWLPAYSRYIAK